MRRLTVVLMLCGTVFGQAERRTNERLWKVSLVTLAAAEAADIHSSWGKCEANPLVAGGAGRFDVRSVVLKSAAVGGLALVEQMTGRRHPRLYRIFSAVNFGLSAGIAGAALHNYRVSTPPATGRCGR